VLLAGRAALGLAALVAVAPINAGAQLSGAHALQQYGLKSGSQIPPSAFLIPTYFDWNVDHIRGSDGEETPFDYGVRSLALFAWVVTPRELLGGTYGFQVLVPFLSTAVELPRLGFESSTSLGLSDIYVMPVNLGWHTPRADYMAGLAFYAPTGNYEPGANDNRGLGMWSFELSGGSTVYFDQKRRWHASALGFYEIHTNKQDQDLKAGSILTIEGGVGGAFLDGALVAGMAYGAQWKMTEDSGEDFPSSVLPGKNHIYTLGPEVTFTGLYQPPFLVSITARYLWDVGARASLEGQRFVLLMSAGGLFR
jgi:hypothetical protein